MQIRRMRGRGGDVVLRIPPVNAASKTTRDGVCARGIVEVCRRRVIVGIGLWSWSSGFGEGGWRSRRWGRIEGGLEVADGREDGTGAVGGWRWGDVVRWWWWLWVCGCGCGCGDGVALGSGGCGRVGGRERGIGRFGGGGGSGGRI